MFGPNAEYFPAFNVADSAITIGGITLVVTVLLGIDYDGTRSRDRKTAETARRDADQQSTDRDSTADVRNSDPEPGARADG